MRVLCVNERTDYVEHGILATMQKMGISVKVFPLGRVSWEQQDYILTDLIRDWRPDIVFTPGWSIGVFNLEAFFRALKRTRAFHVYWATEDPLFFDNVSRVFAPHSDIVFTTAQEMHEHYRRLHIPCATMPFGVNPDLFHKVAADPKYQHDIILVANNYPWFPEDKRFRDEAIRTVLIPLVERGYDVKVYGVDWTNPQNPINIPTQFHGGYCPYLETPTAYSSAKIVLGIQSVNTSQTQTSCRTFEIMGCGAFYLTIHTPSHEAYFQNHKHLVWTHSPEETVELVDYYLANEVQRQKIAAHGQAEVLQQHTYQHRVVDLRQTLRPFLRRKRITRLVSRGDNQ